MNGVATHGDLLERLRTNEVKNSARLKSAGFLGETPSIRCSKCGLYEALVFWTADERRRSRGPGEMHLRCPNGCGTYVKYDPAEEATKKPTRRVRPMLANWVLLPIVLYALYGYSNTTGVGRSFLTQLLATSQAQMTQLGLAIPGFPNFGGSAAPISTAPPPTTR